MSAPLRLGVDVGGTFTDLLALSGEEIVTAKVPSTPADQSEGVMRAIETAGVEGAAVAALAHGMTVATNALLERRGARTALVTTEGFRDLLEIGRQNRPSLYDLTRDRPPALVPRELCFTVAERMGPSGELAPLEQESLEAALDGIEQAGVEAVAVCLLFSFLHPEHERRVGKAIAERLPAVHVSLSSEVLPELREYERAATTTANAYLGPGLATYLDTLAGRLEAAGMPAPLVMRSSGGVVELEAVGASAAACVLSGPAGGVLGAAYAARASGFADVLSFDMGGTSTDVAPILAGAPQTTTEAVVAGVPIGLPMVDVHTVSAGGGSIARADSGGALAVGPRSAGSDPGPAAYARGGSEPTVTDADLLLGYLADGARLGGEVVLSREHAGRALSEMGGRLGLDAEAAALGIVRVADAEMVRALRVISVERGLDPRDFALVAFGGAGPMHACSLAEELGVSTVLVPKGSGVLSALGLAISDLRRDHVTPLPGLLDELGPGAVERGFVELERRAGRELDSPVMTRRADLRYRGQSFELTVEAGGPGELAERFHEAHERRYGYRAAGEAVELVSLRLIAVGEVEKPELREREEDAGSREPPGTRRACFDGAWHEVAVLQRPSMGSGSRVEGPAIVELAEATCVVRPGWSGAVDAAGTIVLARS